MTEWGDVKGAAEPVDQAIDKRHNADGRRHYILLAFLGSLDRFLHPLVDRGGYLLVGLDLLVL